MIWGGGRTNALNHNLFFNLTCKNISINNKTQSFEGMTEAKSRQSQSQKPQKTTKITFCTSFPLDLHVRINILLTDFHTC